MKKEEAKWYEKASGKKQHKAENSAKFAAKNELKKQRKEEKTQKNEAKTEDKKTPQKKVNIENRRKSNFSQNKSSKTVPMFELKNIPADSLEILKNFGKIVAETRNLSPKQQVLLPKQIKNLSHQLTDERNSRRLGYMNDASQLSAYISYFMWWNLIRLTRLFANFPKNAFNLKEEDVCLDLGSGPLTVPCALWLARPELRSKKLTFYVLDLSQGALSAGEEIFLSIAAKTLTEEQNPWKIVRVKGAIGTQIKQKPSLITCANVFNELAQTNEMPPDFLAKNYTNDILKYFDKETDSAQTVLLIEPGAPHSARLVSLMRDSFIRKNFMPLSPCPHIHVCPMAGRTSSNPGGKWCNFAFDTADAPEELLKFSKNANLQKERASLSYVLVSKEKIAKPEEKPSQNDSENLKLRIASDFIKLPELHKSAYYCCSEIGLVLAVDKTNVHPKNGDLLSIKRPKSLENADYDKKSGAVILEI